ncbi:hypothetical protein KCU65_g176, partial [Aureobasidium melanogenum]
LIPIPGETCPKRFSTLDSLLSFLCSYEGTCEGPSLFKHKIQYTSFRIRIIHQHADTSTFLSLGHAGGF